MQVPTHFSDQLSFEEQLIYVLSVLTKASADEVAMELMELKGISSEEGVADLTLETEQALQKLCDANHLHVVKEKRQKNRYALGEG